jgi:hypothetical protein
MRISLPSARTSSGIARETPAEKREDRVVRGWETQSQEIGRSRPVEFLGLVRMCTPRCARADGADVDVQRHDALRIRVRHNEPAAKTCQLDPEFLADLPSEARRDALARLALSAGKLPQPAVRGVPPSSRDECATGVHNHRRSDL